MRHGTLRDAAPGAALGSFGVLHGGIGCCSGIGESPPHSVSDADNPEAVRTAAGRSGTVSLRAAHFSGAAHLGERSCVAVGSERGTEANNRVGPARFGAEANGCDGGGRFRMLPASSFGLDEAAGGSQRRAAAGARWIPSCACLARFRATVTNSTMSAASTTVAAAGWGEDRRGGEEGAEGETNAVTACRGRRTAGRLCARCLRPVAGAGPSGACSCLLRGELIVAQSVEAAFFPAPAYSGGKFFLKVFHVVKSERCLKTCRFVSAMATPWQKRAVRQDLGRKSSEVS